MPERPNRSKSKTNQCRIDLDGLDETEISYLRDRGVIQEGVLVERFRKPPIFMDEFKTAPKFTDLYLALETDIGVVAHRVYHYICFSLRVGDGNWTLVSPTILSEKMGITRPQASKALITLEKKGLLIRGEKIGRHFMWRLNPEAAWVGKGESRWNAVMNDEIPYSDFIEKRLEYGDEYGFKLGYLRGLKTLEGGRSKTPKTKEQLQAQTNYLREVRSLIYGEQYADGVKWSELSEAEIARLHVRQAKVESEMKESGEWQALIDKHFPAEEKPKAEVIDIREQVERKKKAQELSEKIMSGEIDSDALDELLKRSGTG